MSNSPLPPIEDVLPHRGSMLLLDRLCDYEEGRIVAEYTPRVGTWYADASGHLPAWIGIELMAQAAAAEVSMGKRLHGLPVRMGALLGTRAYRSAVPCFPPDQPLKVLARRVLLDESGMGAFECEIHGVTGVLASAVLKVYEPEDFEVFVHGGAV